MELGGLGLELDHPVRSCRSVMIRLGHSFGLYLAGCKVVVSLLLLLSSLYELCMQPIDNL